VKARVAILFICLAGVQCGRQTPIGPTATSQLVPGSQTLTGPASTAQVEQSAPDPLVTVPQSSLPEVFVGAGDIAMCDANYANADATARLLDRIGGTVFALGDNAYMSGTREQYRDCYGPTWGRHRSRTRPVPGNHEYLSSGAVPYFDYYSANAGPHGRGYYSFDLGAWHVVALNSNIAAGTGAGQFGWLRNDLAASHARCTVAYWHHPLFSSGRNGDTPRMRELFRALYEAGAEIVLAAHDHLYERFAPQDPDGNADPVRGIRQFVVGTGGAYLYPAMTVRPNSEIRTSAHGVLKLTLLADRYDWEFIQVSGAGDRGSGTCH
jgi:hypothetical protein